MTGGRRVLFDVNHPAQVHLFRNVVRELERRGHETLIASREKELTTDLLDAYGFEHVPLTTRGSSLPALMWEMLVREVRLYGLARSFDPDVIVSRFSPPTAHVARAVGCRSLIVHDTRIDDGWVGKAMHALTLPFVDLLCTPAEFEYPIPAARQRTLDFQELAYLHPNYFEPDPSVLSAHGVDPDEPYFVLRLAAWDAYHDIGHRGLSREAARELVATLSERGPVYVSSEAAVPPDVEAQPLPVPPHLVHHLLTFADLYVGDSGTMASEAAILGTPAVRINSLVGEDDERIFHDLEREYGLLYSFADERAGLRKVEALLAGDVDPETWRRRRRRVVEEHADVTAVLVDAVLGLAGAEPKPPADEGTGDETRGRLARGIVGLLL